MTGIPVSYVAIIVAALASLLWGWIWHTMCCGKKWASMCGMHANLDKRGMRIATIVSFVGALLTAYVMYRVIAMSYKQMLMPDKSAYRYGLCAAFYIWLGFYVPMAMHATVWMKKTWHFFVAKSANNLINLMIIGLILAYWATLNKV